MTDTHFCAILFADIAQSSKLYETLGDAVAQRIVDASIIRLSRVAIAHKGKVIKTIGDEVMCAFDTCESAVEAARAMQAACEQPLPLMGIPQIQPLNIYIGIHAGQVIRKDGDIFGDAVNLASRLVTLAKQRQILISEAVVHHLTPDLQERTKHLGKIRIKGKQAPVHIFESIWEAHAQTVEIKKTTEDTAVGARIELQCQDRLLTVDQNQLQVSIGRMEDNDLAIDDKMISRYHARIEFRRGHFFLADQSSNGTFVCQKGKKYEKIRHDEIQLKGTGYIAPGKRRASSDPELIQYRVIS